MWFLGLVVDVRVEGQFAEEFSGFGVDDSDVAGRCGESNLSGAEFENRVPRKVTFRSTATSNSTQRDFPLYKCPGWESRRLGSPEATPWRGERRFHLRIQDLGSL